MPTQRTQRSYRATLIPPDLPPEEAMACDMQDSLPTIRVRADNAGHAGNAAHWLTGRPVLKVERIDPIGGAA